MCQVDKNTNHQSSFCSPRKHGEIGLLFAYLAASWSSELPEYPTKLCLQYSTASNPPASLPQNSSTDRQAHHGNSSRSWHERSVLLSLLGRNNSWGKAYSGSWLGGCSPPQWEHKAWVTQDWHSGSTEFGQEPGLGYNSLAPTPWSSICQLPQTASPPRPRQEPNVQTQKPGRDIAHSNHHIRGFKLHSYTEATPQ